MPNAPKPVSPPRHGVRFVFRRSPTEPDGPMEVTVALARKTRVHRVRVEDGRVRIEPPLEPDWARGELEKLARSLARRSFVRVVRWRPGPGDRR